VIQSAGYYPNPIGNTTAASAMPAVTVAGIGTFAAGQIVLGADGGAAGAETDSISVRYMTAGGDGILNCTGGTNTAQTTWINTFQLDASGDFECLQTVNGVSVQPPVVLVSGVKYLSIRYGVQTNTSSATHSVDTYLTATQVTAGPYWGNVMSVQITLYLTNPLAGQPGQTQTTLATIPFTRVIALMSKVGMNT
jgi:type IV pilus assembly protein PilW